MWFFERDRDGRSPIDHQYQVIKLLAYSWSPTLGFALVGPLAAYQFLMPAHDRFGLEYADDISQLIC
jgi:hypothetical protein